MYRLRHRSSVAKHRKGGIRPAKIDHALVLGTLAANDVISSAIPGTVSKRTWVASIDVSATLRGAVAAEGPIVIGIAHSDYTAAEIEECLEASGSWDLGDKIAQEQGRRQVRTIGAFEPQAATDRLNDGKKLRIRCKFALEDGDGLQLWAYNQGGGALSSGTVEILGTAWLSK